MRGVRVWGGHAALAEVICRERICEILLALPVAPRTEIAAILEQCRSVGAATRRIPPLAELVEDRVLVGQIRDVRVEDLLVRPAVHLDEEHLRDAAETRDAEGAVFCMKELIAEYNPTTYVLRRTVARVG